MRLTGRDDPLLEILAGTGRQMADAVVPTAAFVVVWLVAQAVSWPEPILLGGLASIVVAGAVAVVRWRGGERPRAAAVGLLIAVVATLIALYTGRAEDFFLPRIVANAGSLAAWLVSIAIRWPLLGVLLGPLGGEGMAWRRDPEQVRLYSRASWIWVGVFTLRLAVQLPLYLAGALLALGIARTAMGLPIFLLAIWLSYLVLQRGEEADPRLSS